MKDQQQNPSTNGVHSHPPSSEAFTPRPRFEMPPDPPPAPTRADTQAANRRTMLTVLVIMGSMAILGLLFALYTVPHRRANDTKGAGPATMTAPQR